MIRLGGIRRGLVPALLLLLHLGVSAGAVILHGRAEVISSNRAYESSHSEHCAVIHDETYCVMGGLHHVVGVGVQVLPDANARITTARFMLRGGALPSLSVSSANRVRAPPVG